MGDRDWPGALNLPDKTNSAHQAPAGRGPAQTETSKYLLQELLETKYS